MSGTQADDVKVIYISSLGRSGSTLLDRAVGSHPDAWSVGEVFRLGDFIENQYLCSCGEVVSDCTFWRAILDRLSPDHLRILRNPPSFRLRHELLSRPARYEDYCGASHVLYRSILRETGCSVIVDSSKSYARMKALSEAPGFDVLGLYLVRDYRGNAFSEHRRTVRPAQGGGVSSSDPYLWSMVRWLLYNWRIGTVLNDFAPSRRMGIFYEDFCATPHAILSGIFEAIGLPADAGLDGSELHNIGGNVARYGFSFNSIELDNSWQKALPRWVAVVGFAMGAGLASCSMRRRFATWRGGSAS